MNRIFNRSKVYHCSIFFKKLTNHMFIFRAFGRKTWIAGKIWENFENFWWKFNRKIEFLTNFGKSVTKNRAGGNIIIFPQKNLSLCSPQATAIAAADSYSLSSWHVQPLICLLDCWSEQENPVAYAGKNFGGSRLLPAW